jgi:hypothetical protein
MTLDPLPDPPLPTHADIRRYIGRLSNQLKLARRLLRLAEQFPDRFTGTPSTATIPDPSPAAHPVPHITAAS